jgi:hypothetical protein
MRYWPLGWDGSKQAGRNNRTVHSTLSGLKKTLPGAAGAPPRGDGRSGGLPALVLAYKVQHLLLRVLRNAPTTRCEQARALVPVLPSLLPL